MFVRSPGGLQATKRPHSAARVYPTQRRQARLTRHDKTDAAPIETRAIAGGGCGHAHTTSIPTHNRPHQEARLNEQSENMSASDGAPDNPRCLAETARQDTNETPTSTGWQSERESEIIYMHKRRHTTKSMTHNEQGIKHAGARACSRTRTCDIHPSTKGTTKVQPKTRARASEDLQPQATLRDRLATSDGNFAPTSKASAKAERERTRECERPPRCSSTTTRTCLAV